MREFGMKPVLPAFSGFVPDSFIEKYPNVSVSKTGTWGGFNCTFSCVTQIGINFFQKCHNFF